jgi:hypothetical protein
MLPLHEVIGLKEKYGTVLQVLMISANEFVEEQSIRQMKRD